LCSLSAKSILITYPKCGYHVPEDLYCHVECICKENKWVIEKFVASLESHSDGTKHVHIGLHFIERPNIKNCRIFDMPACDVPGCCPEQGMKGTFFQWADKYFVVVKFLTPCLTIERIVGYP